MNSNMIKRYARHLLECLGTVRLSLWAFQHQPSGHATCATQCFYLNSCCIVYFVQMISSSHQSGSHKHRSCSIGNPFFTCYQGECLQAVPNLVGTVERLGAKSNPFKICAKEWSRDIKRLSSATFCVCLPITNGIWYFDIFCKWIKYPHFRTCCTCHVSDLHKSNSWVFASTSTADHTWQQA